MNIFLFFLIVQIFAGCNLLEATGIRTRSSGLYEEPTTDIVSKRPRKNTVKPKVSSVLKLPEAVLAHIFSHLHNPYNQIPLVCKTFALATNLLKPSVLLDTRDTVLRTEKLHLPKTFLRLAAIPSHLLKEQYTFEVSSPVLEHSEPYIQDIYIAQLQNLMTSNNLYARKRLKAMLSTALMKKDVDFLIQLLQVNFEGNIRISDTICSHAESLAFPLYQRNPELVNKLMVMLSNPRPLLCGLLSAPVPLDFIFSLRSTIIQDFSVGQYLTLLHESLSSMQTPEDEQMRTFIYTRNNKFLKEMQAADAALTQKITVACILNELVLNPTTDLPTLFENIRLIMIAFSGEYNLIFAQFTASNYFLLAAIANSRPDVFLHVLRHKKRLGFSYQVREALETCPAIKTSLSFTTYHKIMGNSDVEKLALFRKQKVGIIRPTMFSAKLPLHSRLRLLAKYGSLEEYIQSLRADLHKVKLLKLLNFLVNDLENPAPIVYTTLKQFNNNQIDQYLRPLVFVSDALGNAKFVKSLLKSTELPLGPDAVPLKVNLNAGLASALIDDPEIRAFHGTERYKLFLRHLTAQFCSLFFDLSWTPDRFAALFRALEIPISFRFTKTIPSITYKLLFPYLYFENPGEIQDDLVPHLIKYVSSEELESSRAYATHFNQTGRKNPLLLKSFGLLNFWRIYDWNSFVLHAPFVDAFYPVFPRPSLQKYFFMYDKHPEYIDRILEIYKDQILTIHINSFDNYLQLINSTLITKTSHLNRIQIACNKLLLIEEAFEHGEGGFENLKMLSEIHNWAEELIPSTPAQQAFKDFVANINK